MDIRVYGNDLEKALKSLKRQLQKEGLFREIKQRSYYEKPSARRRVRVRKGETKAALIPGSSDDQDQLYSQGIRIFPFYAAEKVRV
ncbi:MAG: 30S ribosomal protein S21 [Candidatus Sulfobium sp.]